ncbi:MAG: non-ribosomal peptide synthetase, partial [Bradyrhizobium sp.]|nr:non-ribosomal peptide synthetase [Pseudomonadota bacterium]MDE2067014.1 non-ribosomal peptide synthetase [Bradyrhizobium sp.]
MSGKKLALLNRKLVEQFGHLSHNVIRRRRTDEVPPLSFAQERLWFLHGTGLVGPAYNIAFALKLSGRLKVDALAAALTEIVRRHEALRTRFEARDGLGVQLVDPPWPVVLQSLTVAIGEAHQRARLAAERPFDLAADRLLRVELFRIAPEDHVLVLVMHHIVSDGWSMKVLIREMQALYGAAVEGRRPTLRELPIQYADYAVWHRQWLANGVVDRQLAYWTGRLAGAPDGLALPTDRPRPAVQSFRGSAHRFALTGELMTSLRSLARAERATLFMVLLAAFDVLLMRWSGQRDVVVGTPIAGRPRAETEGLIGFFVNMLALRLDLSGDPSFREVVRRVKVAALEAFAHQDLPFEKLVEALQPARDLSRQPVFQTAFALQDVSIESITLPGLAARPLDEEVRSARFDLELSMTEVAGGLSATLNYATDLFDSPTIERLAGHFVRLLEALVADPLRRVSEVSLLGAAERQQLVTEWNDTAAAYP